MDTPAFAVMCLGSHSPTALAHRIFIELLDPDFGVGPQFGRLLGRYLPERFGRLHRLRRAFCTLFVARRHLSIRIY